MVKSQNSLLLLRFDEIQKINESFSRTQKALHCITNESSKFEYIHEQVRKKKKTLRKRKREVFVCLSNSPR